MPAKKKTPKTTRGERAAMVINRWATIESELDRLRKLVFSTESDRMYVEKQLAEANELLKKGKDTLREHAGELVELAEALAAKNKELESYERALAAMDGERTFLWEEYDRFRNRVIDYIRWESQLPESARVALNKVRAQEFEDELGDDARGES